jgi:uncharacterized RDD family membrane protein YckC
VTQDEWYFKADGARRGPVTPESLMALLRRGALPPDTPVWHPALGEWMSANRVKAFAVVRDYQALGTLPSATWQEKGYTPPAGPPRSSPEERSSPPRPWIRYWARMVDVALWSMVGGLLMAIFLPDLLDSTNEVGLGIVLLLGWVFVEALLLTSFGTTPGKALLRIAVTTDGGDKLPYGTALQRSFLVFIKGMGLGLPLISLIPMIVAHGNLSKSGRTTWDRDLDLRVVHREVGFVRGAAVVAILVLFLALTVAGS